jgi:hypothetical protein
MSPFVTVKFLFMTVISIFSQFNLIYYSKTTRVTKVSKSENSFKEFKELKKQSVFLSGSQPTQNLPCCMQFSQYNALPI